MRTETEYETLQREAMWAEAAYRLWAARGDEGGDPFGGADLLYQMRAAQRALGRYETMGQL